MFLRLERGTEFHPRRKNPHKGKIAVSAMHIHTRKSTRPVRGQAIGAATKGCCCHCFSRTDVSTAGLRTASSPLSVPKRRRALDVVGARNGRNPTSTPQSTGRVTPVAGPAVPKLTPPNDLQNSVTGGTSRQSAVAPPPGHQPPQHTPSLTQPYAVGGVAPAPTPAVGAPSHNPYVPAPGPPWLQPPGPLLGPFPGPPSGVPLSPATARALARGFRAGDLALASAQPLQLWCARAGAQAASRSHTTRLSTPPSPQLLQQQQQQQQPSPHHPHPVQQQHQHQQQPSSQQQQGPQYPLTPADYLGAASHGHGLGGPAVPAGSTSSISIANSTSSSSIGGAGSSSSNIGGAGSSSTDLTIMTNSVSGRRDGFGSGFGASGGGAAAGGAGGGGGGVDCVLLGPPGVPRDVSVLVAVLERLLLRPAGRGCIGCVVLTPSRERAEALQEAAFTLVSERAAAGDRLTVMVVHGGTRFADDVSGLRSQPPGLLVATPGRLGQLLSNREVRLGHLFESLRVLVLDGGETLADAGNRQQVEKVLRLLRRNMSSATTRPSAATAGAFAAAAAAASSPPVATLLAASTAPAPLTPGLAVRTLAPAPPPPAAAIAAAAPPPPIITNPISTAPVARGAVPTSATVTSASHAPRPPSRATTASHPPRSPQAPPQAPPPPPSPPHLASLSPQPPAVQPGPQRPPARGTTTAGGVVISGAVVASLVLPGNTAAAAAASPTPQPPPVPLSSSRHWEHLASVALRPGYVVARLDAVSRTAPYSSSTSSNADDDDDNDEDEVVVDCRDGAGGGGMLSLAAVVTAALGGSSIISTTTSPPAPPSPPWRRLPLGPALPVLLDASPWPGAASSGLTDGCVPGAARLADVEAATNVVPVTVVRPGATDFAASGAGAAPVTANPPTAAPFQSLPPPPPPPPPPPEVPLHILPVPFEEHLPYLYVILRRHMLTEGRHKVVVQFPSAYVAALYAKLFQALGFPVAEAHSRKAQLARQFAVRDFAAGPRGVLFASDLGGPAGLDPRVGLTMVIWVGLPRSCELLVQQLAAIQQGAASAAASAVPIPVIAADSSGPQRLFAVGPDQYQQHPLPHHLHHTNASQQGQQPAPSQMYPGHPPPPPPPQPVLANLSTAPIPSASSRLSGGSPGPGGGDDSVGRGSGPLLVPSTPQVPPAMTCQGLHPRAPSAVGSVSATPEMATPPVGTAAAPSSTTGVPRCLLLLNDVSPPGPVASVVAAAMADARVGRVIPVQPGPWAGPLDGVQDRITKALRRVPPDAMQRGLEGLMGHLWRMYGTPSSVRSGGGGAVGSTALADAGWGAEVGRQAVLPPEKLRSWARRFADVMGMPQPPQLSPQAASRMGLLAFPGVQVVDRQRRQQQQQQALRVRRMAGGTPPWRKRSPGKTLPPPAPPTSEQQQQQQQSQQQQQVSQNVKAQGS